MKLKTKLFNALRSIFKTPLLEKGLKRIVEDKRSDSLLGKLVPNNYQYKKGSWRFNKKDGINLKVDIHDYVGHYIYFQFKDIGQESLIALAKEGDSILDIGTNIGSTILKLAQKIGPSGKVFGFEPDPGNYKSCMQNIELNNFTNIHVDNIGLGKESGSYTMTVDTASNKGMNRLVFGETNKSCFEVEVDTLDAWATQIRLNKLDLVKIDVEGFELQVLKGGENILKKYQPVLFIELDDNNLRDIGDSAKQLIEFLIDELGYSLITESVSQNQIKSSDSFEDCHFDIIAKP